MSPTSQDLSLSLQIYKQRSSVRESRRKTRRHVTILSRLGTVASPIGPSLLILSFWLAAESVWTNETLPRLPVGLTLLAEVSLLHNTPCLRSCLGCREQDFLLLDLLSNTSRMSFQSQGLYGLQQFWQITSACCMRDGIHRLENVKYTHVSTTIGCLWKEHTLTLVHATIDHRQWRTGPRGSCYLMPQRRGRTTIRKYLFIIWLLQS